VTVDNSTDMALLSIVNRLDGRELQKRHTKNNAVLSQLPLSWLRQRATLLRAFGHHIMQLLSFCDLTLRSDVRGPLSIVFEMRHLLSSLTRASLLEVDIPSYTPSCRLKLDRLRRPFVDDEQDLNDIIAPVNPIVVDVPNEPFARSHAALMPRTIIEQASQQLASSRRRFIDSLDTLFNVNFRGEAGTDAGGVYREALEVICEDLMRGAGGVFIPTANSKHNVGEQRGDVCVRPGSLPIDGNERELLEFVGQLLVYAARSDIALGLDLPLLFWRLFCGDEVELDDLRDVDVIAYTSLARLRSCANAVLTALAAPPDPPPLPPRPNQTPRAAPSQLSAADAALREAVESLGSSPLFTSIQSDGTLVELRSGGARLKLLNGELGSGVTDNDETRLPRAAARARAAAVLAFVSESVNVLCFESASKIAIMRRAALRLMPPHVDSGLRWWHPVLMMRRVCGAKAVDVDELRRTCHTHVGKTLTDWLFTSLKSFSHADQRRFMRFVFGQSRLSDQLDAQQSYLSIERFPSRHTSTTVDQVLPTAGTCDFSIALPKYSSQEVLAARLLFAVRNCVAIDGDEYASSFTSTTATFSASQSYTDDESLTESTSYYSETYDYSDFS